MEKINPTNVASTSKVVGASSREHAPSQLGGNALPHTQSKALNFSIVDVKPNQVILQERLSQKKISIEKTEIQGLGNHKLRSGDQLLLVGKQSSQLEFKLVHSNAKPLTQASAPMLQAIGNHWTDKSVSQIKHMGIHSESQINASLSSAKGAKMVDAASQLLINNQQPKIDISTTANVTRISGNQIQLQFNELQPKAMSFVLTMPSELSKQIKLGDTVNLVLSANNKNQALSALQISQGKQSTIDASSLQISQMNEVLKGQSGKLQALVSKLLFGHTNHSSLAQHTLVYKNTPSNLSTFGNSLKAQLTGHLSNIQNENSLLLVSVRPNNTRTIQLDLLSRPLLVVLDEKAIADALSGSSGTKQSMASKLEQTSNLQALNETKNAHLTKQNLGASTYDNIKSQSASQLTNQGALKANPDSQNPNGGESGKNKMSGEGQNTASSTAYSTANSSAKNTANSSANLLQPTHKSEASQAHLSNSGSRAAGLNTIDLYQAKTGVGNAQTSSTATDNSSTKIGNLQSNSPEQRLKQKSGIAEYTSLSNSQASSGKSVPSKALLAEQFSFLNNIASQYKHEGSPSDAVFKESSQLRDKLNQYLQAQANNLNAGKEGTDSASNLLKNLEAKQQHLQQQIAQYLEHARSSSSSDSQNLERLQSLLRGVFDKASPELKSLLSMTLSMNEEIAMKPKGMSGKSGNPGDLSGIERLANILNQEHNEASLKAQLSAPDAATSLSSITSIASISTLGAQNTILNAIIQLFKLNLHARAQTNASSTNALLPSLSAKMAGIKTSELVNSQQKKDAASKSQMNQSKALNELAGFEANKGMIQEISKILNRHNANKLISADASLKGQDCLFYTLPNMIDKTLEDIELLIKREDKKDEQEANKTGTTAWNLTMKMSISENEKVLASVKLCDLNIDLQLTANSTHAANTVNKHLPQLEKRLHTLGFSISRKPCEIREIPNSIHHSSLQTVQTYV